MFTLSSRPMYLVTNNISNGVVACSFYYGNRGQRGAYHKDPTTMCMCMCVHDCLYDENQIANNFSVTVEHRSHYIASTYDMRYNVLRPNGTELALALSARK